MKNKLALVLVLCLASLNLYGLSDDFNLEPFDIPPERQGTYIPVVFANQLKGTKLLYESMNIDANAHHTVLFLSKNVCYSDVRFHDGYAIESAEFKDFRFVTNDGGTFCIDGKGNSYKRISGALNSNGYGYDEYEKYVLNVIFDFAKDMKNVEIRGTWVSIDGISYEPVLDQWFLEIKNVALWLRSDDGVCVLVKNGCNGELHKAIRDELFWAVDEKVIKEYPLMFYPADDDLYWSSALPKPQFRYLRNLVYARYGYIFKNKDLKSCFENFTWYKPNPQFSEEDFTREEKSFIERMLEKEK